MLLLETTVRCLCILLFLGCFVPSAYAGGAQLNSVTPGTKVVVRPQRYDYVPSVIVEGDKYRMWWCAAVKAGKGDSILYTEITEDKVREGLGDGETLSPRDVFSNSGDSARFDGKHTCDPSVVHVGGRYYMYYGGIPETQTKANNLRVTTKLGVAVSDDGVIWKRANAGEPILEPRPLVEADHNRYGVGQPSVVYLDPYFYLLYTDTVGGDGVGLYVLRSKTPLFRAEVEELGSDGFVPMQGRPKAKRKLVNGVSADWAYVKSLDGFLVALRKVPGVMQLLFFDRGLTKRLGSVDLPIEWTEGPALSRDRNGWLVAKEGSKGELRFYLFRSVGDKAHPETWDIAASEVAIKLPD